MTSQFLKLRHNNRNIKIGFGLEPSLAGIYLAKVYDRTNRAMCEICSKLTIKTPGRWQDVVLVSLL